MSPAAAAKMIACGYLGRAAATRAPQTVRRELDTGDRPLIVVTAGGGGDGFDLIENFLDAQAASPTLRAAHSLVVTGPLMARGKRDLLKSATRADNLTLIEFTSDLMSYLAAADLVVSMAGYNTICETLSLGARLVLVPRVRPRSEQRLRAERLAARGLARVLLPDDLSPERLAAEVQAALAAPPPAVTLDLGGLARASRAIIEML